jgi:type IV pilus assembly protein PilC
MAGKYLSKEISFGHVGLVEKALFAKHLSVMLKSGIPITEALEIASQSASGKLKFVLRDIQKAVSTGRAFSAALGDYPKVFGNLFFHSVYAGEKSGTLVENLEYVSIQLEKEKDIVSKIRSALFYPSIVFAAALVLGFGIAFFILPKITPIFEGLRVPLPPTTRALIYISNSFQDHGGTIFLSTFGILFFLVWLLRQRFVKPVTHWVFLHSPVMKKIVLSSNIARFARTLGTLLKSGVGIEEALEITGNTLGNVYFRSSLVIASKRVSTGEKLSGSIAQFKDLYPVIVTRMVRVGEESGNLDEALLYVADFYEAEVDAATKTLSAAVEPVLLLFIGLVVGGLALSIITPMYEITGNLRR